MVLPTAQDKWVSLHPSYGLVCWCDDEKLREEFEGLNNIDFYYLCELSDEEKEMLHAKVSILMQRLGIPALSEIVTHEAIYYGPADSSFKTSLVSWALPYAQRCIYNAHPDRYFQLKLSGFENLNRLQIVVVEKLFFRNVIKRSRIASKKRFECSCLLQGAILFTTWESDSHSIFMELSRFLVDGNPELHLANFLHMITTMAESGSTEEQIEIFISNCQKVPKLPDRESVWSLQSMSSSAENEGTPTTTCVSKMPDEPNTSKSRRKSGRNSNWPPVNWRTAPSFSSSHANELKTQAFSSQQTGKMDDCQDSAVLKDLNTDWNIEDLGSTNPIVSSHSKISENEDCGSDAVISCMNAEFDSVDLVTTSDGLNSSDSSNSSEKDQLSCGPANAQQVLTGRLGEVAAFNYFSKTVGEKLVKWANETSESGLPYDIVVGDEDKIQEYIEVKATDSARKDWFPISVREWQFAVKKGESFSIARVVLSGNNKDRITIYKNPVKLCHLGQLQLAVVMPKQQKDFPVIS